jgi:hypothetical protein
MNTDVTITASSESRWAKVFVDGNPVLKKPGTTAITLDEGTHFLTYFIQGNKGQKFKIDITDPGSLAFTASGTLSSNHTTGQHGFTI